MANPISSLISYIRSSQAELLKVSWPTRQQTIRYSALVIIVSVAMAAFFATLDFGLGKVVDIALLRQPSVQSAPNQPVIPDLEPTIQGVDENGNPVDIKVTPLPTGNEGGFKVTP